MVLIAIATARIVTTYGVFNHTSDEPVHVACGMEWLDKGAYKYEPQHPPLARVFTAILPYLSGLRSQNREAFQAEGLFILYHDNHYMRSLALARLGILPFFWIGALVVYFWARRSLGDLEASIAVFLFTFLPPVLAHAGLATTDMALTAFTGASFLTGLVWLDRPAPASAALFGAATGLAVLSKFSALPFLPSAMAAAIVWYIVAQRPPFADLVKTAHNLLPTFLLAVMVGALVIWAGYRFAFDKAPAPALWAGIRQVQEHNAKGHSNYLLGMRSDSGWWYYYLVILAVKTPLPFLGLLGFGCVKNPRKWLPLAFSLGILLFASTSRINIGVRHVLPVYIGFSIVAAAGAVRLLDLAAKVAWPIWALAFLIVWMAATSVLSHPDYLPYFNALAGDEPDKIAVDSDLDWGQDMNRLSARLRELGAREVSFNPFVIASLERQHGFPPVYQNDARLPSGGWNAVSLTVLKELRMGLFDTHPEVIPWPEKFKPSERVGKSILLYYFPPQQR
jgi:4-amino-4-deoxy-L-arabinose transferase-like glycosyltransferase